MKYYYIGDEYKDLINRIFKSGLTDWDLCLTIFDSCQLDLKVSLKIIWKNKNVGVENIAFSFEKSIKDFSNIDN